MLLLTLGQHKRVLWENKNGFICDLQLMPCLGRLATFAHSNEDAQFVQYLLCIYTLTIRELLLIMFSLNINIYQNNRKLDEHPT